MVIDIPTALTETEAFRLQEMAEGKVVLEIGSLLGYSTVHLAQVAKVVHSIDPHEGYPKENPRPTLAPFLANLERYGVRDKVIVHVGRAEQVLPLLRPFLFRFAFIDITGEYLATRYCLRATELLMTRDGWMAVHDMGRTEPDCSGATRAAREFLAHRGECQAFMCDTTMFFGPRRYT